MTFSGGPERCGPSPSDTHGLPRHSGVGDGERERAREGDREEGERGSVITKEIPLNFPPLTQITADFHHNTLSKPEL